LRKENKLNRLLLCLTVFTLLILAFGIVRAESVRYADLGDFKLENGSVIRGCRLAYLTMGTLNSDRSNILLVPTWLAGTSRELVDLGFLGPGKIFDSSKFYIVAVEAFGSGGSSSPSNSAAQPAGAFPRFSILDMVRAQHVLLTEHLKIKHILAVAGISMGAIQTFQWMVSYPDFMDQAVAILGGPWMSSYDKLNWAAQLEILENIRECKGNAAAMRALAPLHIMHVWAPDYRVANTSPEAFPAFLAEQQKMLSKYDAANWAAQVRAIDSHDIRKAFDGSGEKAAATVKAKCLIATSPQDRTSYPGTAKAFARLIGAETAELKGECGHFAFLCERENLKKIVNEFLARKQLPLR
jgi:homoserine O-acetyltransferase